MIVRLERESDRDGVRAVNVAAFETPAEASLVDALRTQARPAVSLVGEQDGAIVGHIMFSPVSLAGHPDLKIMGLAPLAVDPGHQREGIGSALVRAGLERCRSLGVGAVVVLGHPSYYPRFGFQAAAPIGIRCEYDAPEEAFMVIVLIPGHLQGMTGTVRFHPAFNDL